MFFPPLVWLALVDSENKHGCIFRTWRGLSTHLFVSNNILLTMEFLPRGGTVFVDAIPFLRTVFAEGTKSVDRTEKNEGMLKSYSQHNT